METQLPPIWIINLARSTERRAAMRANLDALGLRYEFFEAIDGRNLSADDAARCDPAEAERFLGRALTLSEAGGSLSHLHLYQRQVDAGLDVVIVLEDDASLHKDFAWFVQQVLELPADWDVLHFHDGDPLFPPVFSEWGKRRVGKYTMLRPTTPLDLSVGYLVRLSGARKMLRHGYPVRVPADTLTGGTVEAGLRLYGIKPSLVVPRSGESTLADAYVLRAAIAAQARAQRQRESRVLLAAKFIRERAWRFYQRVSPFARMKLVK